MSTSYRGINYAGSSSAVNRDNSAGIRFGVIPFHDVLQAWCDESETIYPDPELDEDGEAIEDDFCEPIGHVYKREGYHAHQSQDDCDIWIEKSPYFTYAQFCSPCAPGACYLRNDLSEPNEDNKAYCFGHDWFEDGKAPYPVYSVETGELVHPAK
jgi:hypothetical protein